MHLRSCLVVAALLSTVLVGGAEAQTHGLASDAMVHHGLLGGSTGVGIQGSEEILGAPWMDPVLTGQLDESGVAIAIIAFDGSAQTDVVRALTRLGIAFHTYDSLDMAALRLPAGAASAVLAIPGVHTVYHNEEMSSQLSRSVPYIDATAAWTRCSCRGSGVSILIVDSGIDGTHPDVRYGETLLENTVAVQDSFGLVTGHREGVVSSDPDGHGTHVASIAAGAGLGHGEGSIGQRLLGVAPSARIVGFQAGLREEGKNVSFDSMTVLEAFEYGLAKQDAYGIGVVSNSWGARGDFDPRSPINQATRTLYKAGLLVVFAAGNEGEDGDHTLNKYSVAPWVLAVTAGDYLGDLPTFASRGSDPAEGGAPFDHPDLMAPGVEIVAARALTSNVGRDAPFPNRGDYVTMSGSSMAVPHVAGAAALILADKPSLSPDDLMDILTATATPVGLRAWEGGAGYLNVLQAHLLAEQTTGNREQFLDGLYKYAGRESGDPSNANDALSLGNAMGHPAGTSTTDDAVPDLSAATGLGRFPLFFLIAAILVGAAFGARAPASVSPVRRPSKAAILLARPRPTPHGKNAGRRTRQ